MKVRKIDWGRNPDGSVTLDRGHDKPIYTPELLEEWRRQQKEEASSEDYGGPGSGHHGHKGVPGQRGGSAPGGASVAVGPKVTHDVDEQTRTGWEAQVLETWPEEGGRRGMAMNALNDIRMGYSALSIEEDGELKGIASISVPRTKQGILGPIEPSPDAFVTGQFLATKERGYGHEMMKGLAQVAADNDRALSWNGTEKSLPFYEAIGFKPTRGEKGFWLEPDEVKAWLKNN